MGFAITHSGRRVPREGDRVRTADDVGRALAAAGQGAFTLWSVGGGGRMAGHRRVLRWGADARRDLAALAVEVGARMMADAEWAYLNGDCWVLAHVGAGRHGLPVAMVVNDWCADGEPAHLALDLGGGMYLDAKGVSTGAELLARSPRGSWMAGMRLAAGEVGALYDRLYAQDHDDFSSKLADGFEGDTEDLFSMCLDRHVHAVAGLGATPPAPLR